MQLESFGKLVAAALIGSACCAGTANAQFQQRSPRPQTPRVEPSPSLRGETGRLTIKNPLGFTIQQKKSGRWETLGRGTTLTRTINNILPGTTVNMEFRIVGRSNPGQTIFSHSSGGFSSEMYRRQTYRASLGHQGFERSFEVCIPGDRCRQGGSIRSISKLSGELTIRPEPATTSVSLGQAMVFKGNTSTPALPEIFACTQNPPRATYLPYLGGTINGAPGNGSPRNFLATTPSPRNPEQNVVNLSNWCEKTFPNKSGFVTKKLKLSDMIALVAGGAPSYFRNSSLRNMPGGIGAPSTAYWNAGNSYRSLIYNSSTKEIEPVMNFTSAVREKLEGTFTSSKRLYTIRNIYPSNQIQYLDLVDLSGLIRGIDAMTGTLTADGSGSTWTSQIGDKPAQTNDIRKTLREKAGSNLMLGMTIKNRPRRITISRTRLTSSSNNQFAISFRVNMPKISGEIGIDNLPDPDYTISSGTINVSIPFALEKQGESLRVRQLKNCETDSCITSTSGMQFRLDSSISRSFLSFARWITGTGTTSFSGMIREEITANMGKSLQQSTARVSETQYPMPRISSVNGISDPLNYFLRIDRNIIPNIYVNASRKVIQLKYQPQAPFVTPAFMRELIPLTRATLQ